MNIKRFRKRSKYDREKQNKKNNYKYLNERYCKSGQTVLLGDSIMEIFNDGELFAEYREKSGLDVYNRGISGDTTDRLLERLDDNVVNIQPKNIVLLIGTNDYGIFADIDYVYTNTVKIVNELIAKCNDVNIVLMGILPVGKETQTTRGRNNKKFTEHNSMIKKLAKDKSIHYIDLTDKLSDNDGYFSPQYTYDGLHPNAKGFEIIKDEIIKYL